MGYTKKWNGYTGRRLADEAKIAAVSGRCLAYEMGASDPSGKTAKMALEFAQRFDELERLIDSIRDLMSKQEGGSM